MEPYLKSRPVARDATLFSDASVLTPAFGHLPTLILRPGEPEIAHKTNESCYVSKIEQAVEIDTKIANAWCESSSQ
jgi:succinyl-diaminopimelate desuccinylase